MAAPGQPCSTAGLLAGGGDRAQKQVLAESPGEAGFPRWFWGCGRKAFESPSAALASRNSRRKTAVAGRASGRGKCRQEGGGEGGAGVAAGPLLGLGDGDEAKGRGSGMDAEPELGAQERGQAGGQTGGEEQRLQREN